MCLNPFQTMSLSSGWCALWVQDGRVEISGCRLTENQAAHFKPGALAISTSGEPATVLRFEITDRLPDTSPDAGADQILLQRTIEFSQDDAILRLDRVTFPKDACAYRHVHPGPGIRYMTHGRLEIESDEDTTVMNAGSAWFEPANSPVRATAREPSQFVRVLILPAEFMGRPSLQLLNAEDFDKPRLQQNHRYFDIPL
jgi:quercetin dioxygenase-like cupin family protein